MTGEVSILDIAGGLARRTMPVAVTGFSRSPDGRALFLKEADGSAAAVLADSYGLCH